MQIPVDVYFIGLGVIMAIPGTVNSATRIYLRALPFFLILTIAIEILGAVLTEKHIHTVLLFNIFTSFEFIFYFWMLRLIISNRRVKNGILISIIIYPVLAGIEIIFVAGPDHFHTVTYSFGCLMVVFFCIFYFFELFQLPHSLNLFTEPAFWICSGLLFFYTATFAMFGIVNVLGTFVENHQKPFSDILDIMNILLYSSFAVALICRIRARKSL